MAKRVVVVGGGFVGLSCAMLLRRAGHAVTLLEAQAVASGVASASYGNAGTFAAYACVHANRPGLAWDLPRMLASSRSPLSIAPSPHLLRMLPWFAFFLQHCRADKVQASSAVLGALLARAEEAYADVWEAAGVHVDDAMGHFASSRRGETLPFAARHGYLLLQKTPAMMQASHSAASTRRECVPGLRMEALSTAEVLKLEPNLSPDAAGGGAWFFPDGWFLREPGALLRALADGFVALGGDMRCGCQATRLTPHAGGVCIRLDPTQHGEGGVASIEADHVVVACGAHSTRLAKTIGDWFPLDTERGYHVEWPAGSDAVFTRAVCDPSQGFICSPMSGGLRSAGKVELGGTAAAASPARCDALDAGTRAILSPAAADALGPRVAASDWLGFRPTMPDGLPVIGPSPRSPRVLYAFGHQHIGWTLGGITAQLISKLVAGQQPDLDLTPLRPNRFSIASLLR